MRPAALDELRILIVVDNETDTLSSVDDGVPQRPELLGHIARGPRRSVGEHVCCEPLGSLCVACHGFSALVTGRRDKESHTVLFDAGPYSAVWLDNAQRLGVELSSIERVFLSHWHYDHSGAMPDVVQAIAAERKRRGLAAPIVDVHPDRPDQRGFKLPDSSLALLPPEPTLEAFRAVGGVVDLHAEPHAIDGFFHASGAITRQTTYETGMVGHHSLRAGVVSSDPLIMDERFLAAEVAGRGVTVLSACSHAGIVNAGLAAAEAFDGAAIDLLVGGFHLAGKRMEERIDATVSDLATRVRPRLVGPGHCTGWRAKAALAKQFAPLHYAPSVVGSIYELRG
ncbi:MAG TPA: MBL fold metallo-hydrolase [Polyangiales bacterium]|nr:MBL fold metallo-hydrolase [Polyangiales bacterium]